MRAHNRVVAGLAHETGFAAVVRAQMFVIDHAGREIEPLADGGAVEHAGKVDPFAAVARPGRASTNFRDGALQQFGFERGEMSADHANYFVCAGRSTGTSMATGIVCSSTRWRKISVSESKCFSVFKLGK